MSAAGNNMTAPLVVFLAEDNPGDVYLVRHALQTRGLDFQLFVAEDGDKVEALLNRIGTDVPPPDVLLLDLNLPRMDGPELFRRVRSHPACAGVPLVVVTSSDAPKDHAWTEEFRVNHYFRKPSSLGEFMDLGEIVETLTAGRPGHQLHV
jgi:CheY-like chemotaxis protein